jgi:nitrogen fixation protein
MEEVVVANAEDLCSGIRLLMMNEKMLLLPQLPLVTFACLLLEEQTIADFGVL